MILAPWGGGSARKKASRAICWMILRLMGVSLGFFLAVAVAAVVLGVLEVLGAVLEAEAVLAMVRECVCVFVSIVGLNEESIRFLGGVNYICRIVLYFGIISLVLV